MQKGESSAVSLWMAIKLETELLFPTFTAPQKTNWIAWDQKSTKCFFPQTMPNYLGMGPNWFPLRCHQTWRAAIQAA